jgi:hypothetical protein
MRDFVEQSMLQVGKQSALSSQHSARLHFGLKVDSEVDMDTMTSQARFVSGHDFSRAEQLLSCVKRIKSDLGFSPCGCFLLMECALNTTSESPQRFGLRQTGT